MRIPTTRLLALTAGVLIATTTVTATAQTALPAVRDEPYPGVVRLEVDATDLDRRIFRVVERLPVRPGPLTLLFPRYLPGTHGPYGRVERLAGLKIAAADRAIAWQRDTLDPYAFRVDVPVGVAQLDIGFQFLSPVDRDGGRVAMTAEMLSLQWNSVLLYPAGYASRGVTFEASLRLPDGWRAATALPLAADANGRLDYRPASLETLVDSPVFAGRYLRRFELDLPGTPNPVALNLVADEPGLLNPGPEQLQAHRDLVVQADRLFGARHFGRYEFLLSLSERMGWIGLEHHESSENGVGPSYFKDWAKRPGPRELLPHEYVHSWNGKFRRPRDLWTPSFEVPMQDSLLWVYEGQTQFWGGVLAARSGLVSLEQARDHLANVVAALESRAGRTWRNLQDTTNEAVLGNRRSATDWFDWQRGTDYYDEATLIWLDADMLIRERSGGTKSLDDFARAFFGVENGRVEPLLYGFDDVVAALERVQPHDWRAFLRERLDTNRPGAPLDGLARAGWKLAWADTPSAFVRDSDREPRVDDYGFSIGVALQRDGRIESVRWDSPAYRAGLTRMVQLVAVNGFGYRPERLAAAITANRDGQAPLELIVKHDDRYRTVRIDYRGGLRYPRLERLDGTPERLDAALFAPRR